MRNIGMQNRRTSNRGGQEAVFFLGLMNHCFEQHFWYTLYGQREHYSRAGKEGPARRAG